MRRAWAIAIPLGALLLASCSAGTSASDSVSPSASGSAPASSVAPDPTPAASPLTTAVEATAALGTARIALGTSAQVGDGREYRVAGSGTVDLGQRLGLLLLRTDAGDQGLLVNRDGTFVSTDGGATWMALPPGEQTPHTGSIDVLRGLADLPVYSSEPAVVDGIDTTRYDAVVPADDIESAIAGMGIPLEDPAALAGWVEPWLAVSAWVDGAGRIVRVERTLTTATDAGPLSATSIASLSDFGTSIDLSTPDDATPAPGVSSPG